MSISDQFSKFCTNIRIPSDVVENISYRYKRITKQLNTDYWDTTSETAHSLYVGSYGRDTDIHVSDIDIIFRLPWSVHERIDARTGNKQSALLQEVCNSIKSTYPTTHISGDGQVVKVNFTDGISFEIIPGFEYSDESFLYPDTNGGGSWKKTNPRKEIEAIRIMNNNCNQNLKNLSRIIRAWKDQCNVPIGGLLIDTLAYNFIKDWEHKNQSYLYYDFMVRDFLKYLKNQDENKQYWLAPGSSQYVYRKGKFEYKALVSYNKVLEAIKDAEKYPNLARQEWREVLGNKFD